MCHLDLLSVLTLSKLSNPAIQPELLTQYTYCSKKTLALPVPHRHSWLVQHHGRAAQNGHKASFLLSQSLLCTFGERKLTHITSYRHGWRLATATHPRADAGRCTCVKIMNCKSMLFNQHCFVELVVLRLGSHWWSPSLSSHVPWCLEAGMMLAFSDHFLLASHAVYSQFLALVPASFTKDDQISRQMACPNGSPFVEAPTPLAGLAQQTRIGTLPCRHGVLLRLPSPFPQRAIHPEEWFTATKTITKHENIKRQARSSHAFCYTTFSKKRRSI